MTTLLQIKEYNRNRMLIWRRNNPDKIKIQNKKNSMWRKNNPDKVKAQKQRNYLKHTKQHKEKRKEYYKNNKEKALVRAKEWAKNNPTKVKASSRKCQQNIRKNNPERINLYQQKWQKNNREKIRNYKKKYLEKNLNGRLSEQLRSRINKALKVNGVVKTIKTLELIGTSIEKLKIHLEKQFLSGMSWENHSYYGWHIDHIIPLDSFNLSDVEQQKKACHYTNLQPLWWKDNLKKHNKI